MGMYTDFKFTQAIVVRKDIEIPKGKLAVQVAHASVGLLVKNASIDTYNDIIEWFIEGQRKIVFKCENLDKIFEIAKNASEYDIPQYIVKDMACTVFENPTVTCIGLGPCTIEKMNLITKDLKLY